MAKTATRSVELVPIDRLEEKIKLLVGMVDRMKAEQARAPPKRTPGCRASSVTLRGRLSASDGLVNELSALKEERDVIRIRVTDMLEQLVAPGL